MASSLKATGEKRRFRIFYVDDDRDDHFLLREMGRRCGLPFDWKTATTVKSATAYLNELTAAVEGAEVWWPDIILLDVVMPGDSGLEVLKLVRRMPALARTPVVVLTGSLDPRVREDALSYGATLFVEKSVDFKQVGALMGELHRMLTGCKWGGSVSARPAV